MAVTRKATGSSKPRVFPSITSSSTTTTKKTRKPKTSSTVGRPKNTTAGTTKTVAKPKKARKGKSSLGDKVKGAIEKVEGTIERKPGKKAAGTAKIRGTDGRGGVKKV